jgi:hypothetical protein
MKQYHYIDAQNQTQVTNNEEELLSIVDRNTLIWFEGLSDWTPAENIFRESFNKLPPPMPQVDKKVSRFPFPQIDEKINVSFSFNNIPSKIVLIPLFIFIISLIINILYELQPSIK